MILPDYVPSEETLRNGLDAAANNEPFGIGLLDAPEIQTLLNRVRYQKKVTPQDIEDGLDILDDLQVEMDRRIASGEVKDYSGYLSDLT